jgi:hypothetical protein
MSAARLAPDVASASRCALRRTGPLIRPTLAASKLVTRYLGVSGMAGQMADMRPCKMGHQTPDNCCCRDPRYRSPDDPGWRDDPWSRPTP